MNDVVTTLKALSDETRLRILKLLEQGELCVCEIVAAFDAGQPRVSFHLAALRNAGLVKDRREGKWMYYRIDDSDLFKRFLLLSVLERIPEKILKEDRQRLKEFQGTAPESVAGARCCKSDRVRHPSCGA
jgi:ArsR family transcriptional regulator